MKAKLITIAMIGVMSAFSQATQAASVTYQLTEAANTQWSDSFNYVTVVVNTVVGGDLHFSVQGNAPTTITAFAFNLNLPSNTAVTLTMDNTNVGWSQSNGNSYSIFGSFEYEVTGTGNNPANAFGFTVSALESNVNYDLSLSLFENNAKGYFMAANVKCPTGQNTVNGPECTLLGANGRNANSDVAIGDFQPPPPPANVPVPAAAWLFGSALLGFVGVGNRRKV